MRNRGKFSRDLFSFSFVFVGQIASNTDSSSRQSFETDISSQSDDLLRVFNKQGHCALHTAVISDNLFVLEVLLKSGADVNFSTNKPV